MKKSFKIFCLVFCLLVLIVFPVSAQRKITIKLASLVPESSPWGDALNFMAAEWTRITNGEVELIIYHGGTAGGEDEVLRKLRLNEIQAAIFTGHGLNLIMNEIMTISYPFLIHNDEEYDVVIKKIRPEIDAKFQQSGYVTLAVAKAGWAKIFSRTPIVTIADMRRSKMGTSPTDQEMIDAFRIIGFPMVGVGLNDVLVSLNSGMIDSYYMSPLFVAANQIFGVSPNMLSLNLAPVMGGIVMNNTAWRRIPAKYHDQLQAVCKKLEAEIESSIGSLEDGAVAKMQEYGLKINTPSAAQEQEWYSEINKYEKDLVGPVFRTDLYRKITDILNEYHRGQ